MKGYGLMLQLKCRLDRIERRMSLCSQKKVQQPQSADAQPQTTDPVKSTSKKFVSFIELAFLFHILNSYLWMITCV